MLNSLFLHSTHDENEKESENGPLYPRTPLAESRTPTNPMDSLSSLLASWNWFGRIRLLPDAITCISSLKVWFQALYVREQALSLSFFS